MAGVGEAACSPQPRDQAAPGAAAAAPGRRGQGCDPRPARGSCVEGAQLSRPESRLGTVSFTRTEQFLNGKGKAGVGWGVFCLALKKGALYKCLKEPRWADGRDKDLETGRKQRNQGTTSVCFLSLF